VLAVGDDRGPNSFDDFLSDETTPEYLAQLDEQLARLMESLPDQVSRDVVEKRLEG
jgi:hypothetical protein